MKCCICHERITHAVASIQIPGHDRRSICRPCAAAIAAAVGYFCFRSSEALAQAEVEREKE